MCDFEKKNSENYNPIPAMLAAMNVLRLVGRCGNVMCASICIAVEMFYPQRVSTVVPVIMRALHVSQCSGKCTKKSAAYGYDRCTGSVRATSHVCYT